jgi:phospholipid/cholesterol/gamma-HCH transport system ATP-binding protein
VEKGEIFSIVGRSGTGKSVTLKHIVGLLSPDSGTVSVQSERIGYLFQGGALMAWMTVAENVALPLVETTSLPRGEIDARVAAALEAVGLSDCADKYPSEISGGMQKRAGLARSIVRETDIVLYDEPTSGLDPVTSASINRLIARLRRERGVTSVVVTHDLAAALSMSDRVMLIKDGRVMECSAPSRFEKSNNPVVREFLAAAKGVYHEQE